MKILFLTTILPVKPKSGGEIVTKLFIDNFQKLGHSVDVLGYLRKNDKVVGLPENMHLVKKIIIESSASKLFTVINLTKSIIRGICYSSKKYITKEYIMLVQKCLSLQDYDLIIIDHFQMGWLLDYLPSNISIASIAHNIESDLYQQLSKKTRGILSYIYKQEARKMCILEKKLIFRSKNVWTLSKENKKRYIELFSVLPEKLRTACIPPTLDPDENRFSMKSKWDIGIIGTWTWKANMDGLMWFFEKVYPLLPRNITICIAGLGAEFLYNKYNNVKYLGFVDSARFFMNSSRVIAIPSVSGDGIQIKTIESIVLGINIVATKFALRSIDNVPSFVKCADNSIEFSKQLLLMLQSKKDNHIEAKEWSNVRKLRFIESLTIINE